jgi:peroxidase
MLGATGQPRSRDFKQVTYADGISAPREGPNAREVSNAFFQRKERLHYEHTPLMLGLVEFIMCVCSAAAEPRLGSLRYLRHDVTYSEDSDTEMIEVPIPPNDPAYKHRAGETFKCVCKIRCGPTWD